MEKLTRKEKIYLRRLLREANLSEGTVESPIDDWIEGRLVVEVIEIIGALRDSEVNDPKLEKILMQIYQLARRAVKIAPDTEIWFRD